MLICVIGVVELVVISNIVDRLKMKSRGRKKKSMWMDEWSGWVDGWGLLMWMGFVGCWVYVVNIYSDIYINVLLYIL